jgi:hypothetical protein
MTTKLNIKLAGYAGWDVRIIPVDAKTREPNGTAMTLGDGEAADLYIHSGTSLVVEEIQPNKDTAP